MNNLKFLYWFDGRLSPVGSLDLFESGDFVVNEEDWIPSDHLLQFTNCIDKDGSEIYRGFILQIEAAENHSRYDGVEVKDGFGCFVVDGIPLFLFKPENLEIIGNVFQNPELLKK